VSSKRHLRRKACAGKVRHATAGGAFAGMKRTPSGLVGKLGTYHCPHCNGWHVGHQKRRKPGRNARGRVAMA
jgi:hypothetical protein